MGSATNIHYIVESEVFTRRYIAETTSSKMFLVDA